MKKTLLPLLILASSASAQEYKCASTKFTTGMGIGYSTHNEFSFGFEAGIIPASSSVYFTIGGIAYTAKKNPNERWATAEAGGRMYYFKKVSETGSLHLFGQIRYVTQGGERNGYNQWSPGIGAALTKRISQNEKGEGYLKFEVEHTFLAPVSRTSVWIIFVGVL